MLMQKKSIQNPTYALRRFILSLLFVLTFSNVSDGKLLVFVNQ